MTKPLVSIVCTVYNKEKWLRQTIDSFLAQEASFEFDIILIDDASTDGSAAIISEYVDRFPRQVRAYFNDDNLGITRTWVKVCELVEASYLARCDGDDYWTDCHKLAAQVAHLEARDDSDWVSTDIDYIDELGSVLQLSVFESHHLPLVHDYESMLVTRGFTAPSTWLVTTSLMQEVNREIDLDTADDTFNIQLELFKRTKLTYIPESMVAYRINQGSDSRPKDFKKQEDRFHRLLKTQLDYVRKYPDSDFTEMTEILLDRVNRFEIELSRPKDSLAQLESQSVTIYFREEGQFHQDNSLTHPLLKRDKLTISRPDGVTSIRIDLSELPSFYRQVRLIAVGTDTEILPVFTNGIVLGSAYLFPHRDPQLTYHLPEEYGNEFILEYEMYELDDILSDDYIGKVLGKELHEAGLREKSLVQCQFENAHLKKIVQKQREDLENITQLYNSTVTSRRWQIPTKIINFFRRKK